MDERVAAYLGIAPLNYRTCNTRLMQMICAVSLSPERYANESYHRNIQPPVECPHCDARDALEALGYYSRNVTPFEHKKLCFKHFCSAVSMSSLW